MNWSDLSPIIGAIAPTAGKLLGGLIPFPGGSLIGEQFGRIIARQLGVPETPQAVSEAIAKNKSDENIAAINAATDRARLEIQGFIEYEKAVQETIRASIVEANQTMRLEILPENRHWFFTGWRPAAGWVLVFNAAAFGVILNVAVFMAAYYRNAEPLRIISDAWPVILSYFGALAALVGVYVIARTKDKETSATAGINAPPAAVAPKKK